ncbi:MAG: restriction endonuclease [bacterium]
MAIPDFQSIMFPLMEYAADKKEHTMKEAVEELSILFDLTEDEKKALLPSRRAFLFSNRAAWAKFHLAGAGLLESPERGVFRITERGLNALNEKPSKINIKYLSKFPEYKEFKAKKNETETVLGKSEKINSETTPEEQLEESYQSIRQSLAQELISTIKKCSPSFFERTVVDLLLKMGYGGSRIEAGKAVGKSGDEGIDGIIDQDRLGLDSIYIQAKRWEGTVGSPEIMKFAGAIQRKKAKKGVFITTGRYSKDAYDYVNDISSKIVLIDGERLAQLMIDFNIGVSIQTLYEIKKLDTDYFLDE